MPTNDLPLSEATQELTGFEVIGIQKHYGRPFEQLSGTEVIIGTVWAFENRREPTPWKTVEGWTLREFQGYFAEESVEPEDDTGKE